MDRQEYVLIRNTLETQGGQLLIKLINDYITDSSTSSLNGEIIKGMGMLAHEIKRVPEIVQQMK
jgi:hypothetical protein